MCTAVSFTTKEHYFGRNLDLEYSFQENVTVTPRSFPFHFRCGQLLQRHYAMVGMATVADGYPLYYEATNEMGLSLAGLNFPGNAVYYPEDPERDNIAPFELVPWILGQCADVAQAKKLLEKANLWNVPFSQDYPLSPLHWMLSDKHTSLVLEPLADGLKIYENPVGVLTNNPPFDYHLHRLSDFMNLTSEPPVNRFSDKISLERYSLGMGSIGLPGDMSSPSRFVKAAFTKLNSLCGESENESVSQFFHILSSVAQQRGLTCVRPGEYEFTLYSSCCNTNKGIYYYTTYENSRITAVDMHAEDLESDKIIRYPLRNTQDICFENR